jgi:hypothetical protein
MNHADYILKDPIAWIRRMSGRVPDAFPIWRAMIAFGNYDLAAITDEQEPAPPTPRPWSHPHSVLTYSVFVEPNWLQRIVARFLPPKTLVVSVASAAAFEAKLDEMIARREWNESR